MEGIGRKDWCPMYTASPQKLLPPICLLHCEGENGRQAILPVWLPGYACGSYGGRGYPHQISLPGRAVQKKRAVRLNLSRRSSSCTAGVLGATFGAAILDAHQPWGGHKLISTLLAALAPALILGLGAGVVVAVVFWWRRESKRRDRRSPLTRDLLSPRTWLEREFHPRWLFGWLWGKRRNTPYDGLVLVA
jgi:hypothetical protein